MRAKDDPEALAAAPGRRGSWIARYKPDLSVRFFSSSPDAPRARRPTDLVLPFLAALTPAAWCRFRLLTFYLPPIWGGFAMRWLRRQAYL